MGREDLVVKKYVVRLSTEERAQLEAMLRRGKHTAQHLTKARILLKADVSEAGEGWSDNELIKALETGVSMVDRAHANSSLKKVLRPCLLARKEFINL